MASNGKGKGKRIGVKNYQKALLLNVIAAVLPVGANEWSLVAQRYQQGSGEVDMRDASDIKRYFIEKCCNKMKKTTGDAGNLNNPVSVASAQRIYQSIIKKENGRNFGGGDSSDSEDEDEDIDDEGMDFDVQDNADGEDEENCAPNGPASSNTVPPSLASLAAMGHAEETPLPAAKKARKSPSTPAPAPEKDNKSKNIRSAPHPRASTGQAIAGLVGAVQTNMQNQASAGIINGLQQQVQNLLAAQQAQQQQNQAMMQQMMLMFLGRGAPLAPPAAAPHAPAGNAQDHTTP